MATRSFDSSDDDGDNVYCNAAAKLRALKNQRKNKPKPPFLPSKQDDPPAPKEIKVTRNKADVVSNGKTSLDEVVETDEVKFISDESNAETEPESKTDIPLLRDAAITIQSSPIRIADSPVIVQSDVEDIETETEDDNTLADVNVRWKSNKIECLQLNMNEPLMKIFQHFANLENIPVNRVILTRRGMPVKTNDTPASLKLSIIDVLEGGVVNTDTANSEVKATGDDDEDICKIKAQVSSKKSLTFQLKKEEPFKKLGEYCAKELDVPIEKIRFYFDGEHVIESDTPNSLDLDDAACIDVKILD